MPHADSSIRLRIRGLILIVNTIGPIAIILFVVVAGMRFASRVESSLDFYIESVNRMVLEAQKSKNAVTATKQSVSKETQAAMKDADDMASRIDAVAINVKAEAITAVTSINEAMPIFVESIQDTGDAHQKALAALQTAFSPLTQPFVSIANELSNMGSDFDSLHNRFAAITAQTDHLEGLQIYLDGVIKEFSLIQEQAERLEASLSSSFKYTASITLTILAWLVFCFFWSFVDRLKEGWRLLLHGRLVE